MMVRPAGGRLGDRHGYFATISGGMLALAAGFFLLAEIGTGDVLWGAALLIGVGQALIQPSTLALFSSQISPAMLGVGHGVFGTMRNFGKI